MNLPGYRFHVLKGPLRRFGIGKLARDFPVQDGAAVNVDYLDYH